MQLTTEELLTIHHSMSDKDVEIALLRKENMRLAEENKQLAMENERLRNECACANDEIPNSSDNFLILNVEKVCKMLRGLSDINLRSVMYMALHKMMSAQVPREVEQRIADAVSMESRTLINVTAQGDVKVAGDMNQIYDNENIYL